MVQVYNDHIDDVISGTKNIEIKRRMDWASSAQMAPFKDLEDFKKTYIKASRKRVVKDNSINKLKQCQLSQPLCHTDSCELDKKINEDQAS